MDFNQKLDSFYKNIEKLDSIHDEYEAALDSDHYMVKLSKTLADSCNQFIKFIEIMPNKDLCIDIYTSLPLDTLVEKSVFKRKKKMKICYQDNKDKINKVLDQMDIISKMIDEAVAKIK